MFKKTSFFASVLAASFAVVGCTVPQSSDTIQNQQTEQLAKAAAREVPVPAITNFSEKRLLKDIYEMRDDPKLRTYAYVQGLDGTFRCLGRAIGYGIPYSTQFVNPERYKANGATLPQPEPNGIFIPEGMSATWLQLVGPDGKPNVVYLEPTITVSPVALTGPAVSAPC